MAHHSPFMTVAGAGKARDMVSNSQLLTHFIWVFGPRPRGPFFCLIGKLLRKNMVTRHAHDIVTAFPPS